MKKILPIAIASLALSATAADFSPTIGVTSIELSNKNNIIPVQFTSLASGGAISADALVCTNNIPLNSHLYVYDSAGYTAWVLEGTGWSPLSVAGTADGISFSGDATAKTLGTGTAIWLSFPTAPASAVQVAVYGQVATTTNVTIEAGSKAAPKSYLLCNVTASDVALSTKVGGLALEVGDTIQPIASTFAGNYVYGGEANGWVYTQPGASPEKNKPLPTLTQYQGFWFISKGGNGTIEW